MPNELGSGAILHAHPTLSILFFKKENFFFLRNRKLLNSGLADLRRCRGTPILADLVVAGVSPAISQLCEELK